MIIFLLLTLWDYSYNLDIDFNYDSNIFAYSQSYIDDFLNYVDSYRFPFETYDDLTTSLDFGLLLRNQIFGKRITTFSFNLGSDNYLVNSQKTNQKYGFGVRQSFGQYALKISYEVIPGYLIRYYRNPLGTSTEYIGCEATYHTIAAKASFETIENIKLSAGYGHRWDNYIQEFNQYDANGHIIFFGFDKQLRKNLDFGFSYTFLSSHNDSADMVSSAIELTPDGSFYQHSLNGDFSLRVNAILPTTIGLSYDYSYRSYSTSSAEDSLHFGRRDHRHIINLNTSSRILTGIQLRFLFTWQWRNATSEILPDIDEIKDYTKYKAGVGLEFYF